MYQTILVPLDGSRRAEAILPHVENMARHYEARVVFMEVIEPLSRLLTAEPVYASFDPTYYEERVKEARAYLEHWRENFQKKGIETHVRLSEGPVVEAIIKMAEDEGADLIAMSSHGRTGLASVFYGSVAAGVLHRIDRPLLLVRSPDHK